VANALVFNNEIGHRVESFEVTERTFFFHQLLNPAVKGGNGRAGDGRQRPVQGAHNGANLNLVRRAGQGVAAAPSFLRVDKASVTELGQNMIEKLLRDRIGLSNSGDLSHGAGLQSGQMDHRLEAVFPLVREHNLPFQGVRAEARYASRR